VTKTGRWLGGLGVELSLWGSKKSRLMKILHCVDQQLVNLNPR
jgi:hypothetical protein